MTLVEISTARFRIVFYMTAAASLMISLAYLFFVWISSERAATRLVESHVQRLVESSRLREEELFIQREISQFVASLRETQNYSVAISVRADSKLIAQAGDFNDLGFRIKEYRIIAPLQSGEKMEIRVRIDMSRQILSAIFVSFGLSLLTNLTIFASYITIRNSLSNEVKPISELASHLVEMSKNLPDSLSDPVTARAEQIRSQEIQNLIDGQSVLMERLIELYRTKAQAERFRIRSEVAAQVAHDIRSPLSALNMVTSILTEVPSEKRQLLRQATQRINDISQDLLEQSKQEVSQGKAYQATQVPRSKVMLADLLDAIVSEKRAQFADKSDLQLSIDLSRGYDLFSEIEPSELARTVSNLINNAIEACDKDAVVDVTINNVSGRNHITISDNGKGIPNEVMKTLGVRGQSFGKSVETSGFGLGLYHARRTIENAGGN
ncbi:MAG: HAMP domain-containing histidine kinase, partial [Bdellovibrionales bacterium]|nr:HAMP domain-containing histidine kinase [Bdellovibrionales bacterium]